MTSSSQVCTRSDGLHEPLSRRCDGAAEKAGIEVYEAPAAVLDTIKSQAADAETAWSEAISADGYDGAAALEELRKQAGVDF